MARRMVDPNNIEGTSFKKHINTTSNIAMSDVIRNDMPLEDGDYLIIQRGLYLFVQKEGTTYRCEGHRSTYEEIVSIQNIADLNTYKIFSGVVVYYMKLD